MNKIKLLLSLLGLIILPIIANIIIACVFPLLLISCIFSDDDDFYRIVKTYKESLAKFE